jgi:DNA (cytosine-5)-methyltransferase 1
MKQLLMKEIREIPKRKSVISLFSGYGANTIGYNLAGLDVKIAIDFHKEVRKVYEYNHKNVIFVHKDIKDIKGEELLNLIGYEKEEIDILDASPPSNLFSKSRKLSFEQRTDSLILEIARIIEEIMPKVFIISNEKKLSTGKSRLFLNEMMELLKELGYKVDFEVLNARYYGVAQDKETLFIIGVRNDLKVKPVFPEAIGKTVTTRDVLEDLLHVPMDFKTNPSREEYITKYFRPGVTEEEIEDIMEAHELKVKGANYKRDKWEEPFYALKKNFTRPIHPEMDRVLSMWEAMRIQSYPDDFVLSSMPSLNWQKICSSVSPNLIKCIAETINKDILERLH